MMVRILRLRRSIRFAHRPAPLRMTTENRAFVEQIRATGGEARTRLLLMELHQPRTTGHLRLMEFITDSLAVVKGIGVLRLRRSIRFAHRPAPLRMTRLKHVHGSFASLRMTGV